MPPPPPHLAAPKRLFRAICCRYNNNIFIRSDAVRRFQSTVSVVSNDSHHAAVGHSSTDASAYSSLLRISDLSMLIKNAALEIVVSSYSQRAVPRQYQDYLRRMSQILSGPLDSVTELQLQRLVEEIESNTQRSKIDLSQRPLMERALRCYCELVANRAISNPDVFGRLRHKQSNRQRADKQIAEQSAEVSNHMRCHLRMMLCLRSPQHQLSSEQMYETFAQLVGMLQKGETALKSPYTTILIFHLVDLILFDAEILKASPAARAFAEQMHDHGRLAKLCTSAVDGILVHSQGNHANYAKILVQDAISYFKDPSIVLACLRTFISKARHPEVDASFLSKLDLVRQFEHNFGVLVDDRILVKLMFDANFNEDLLAQLVNYVRVEKPRKEFTSNFLSRLFGCAPKHALDILHGLDPLQQEHVVWNGNVVMERLTASVVMRDESSWLSLISAIVDRRKRLGQQKYLFGPMVTTDSQKNRFQSTSSNILATLGVMQSKEHQDLVRAAHLKTLWTQWSRITVEQIDGYERSKRAPGQD